MALKKFRPTSAGTRHRTLSTFDEVTESKPEKSLLKVQKRSGGRNNVGKMTMRYIGGGHKKMFRVIDFKRAQHGIAATVKTIEYDPNRSALIALVVYTNGLKTYILAPQGLKVGQKIVSGPGSAPEIGNALPLSEIPLGTIIHNIEMQPGKGASLVRGAGAYAQLAARDGKYAVVKLPSGETRMILITCLATVGAVSNPENNLIRAGKAGRNRWKGIRPRVRGVAMNPVDHPMGGGEGRASGGHPRSRKGLPAKGYKTRAPKKYSNKLIIEKRKK
ncbi:MAG TPA: 50S ribosomal protein L2 [Flavobacteriales bacterium]|nr:50S ribosomal protein L2 [Flavobacteriales bacterium]